MPGHSDGLGGTKTAGVDVGYHDFSDKACAKGDLAATVRASPRTLGSITKGRTPRAGFHAMTKNVTGNPYLRATYQLDVAPGKYEASAHSPVAPVLVDKEKRPVATYFGSKAKRFESSRPLQRWVK